MKNSNFSRLAKLWFAALVLVCGVAFTGCKPEADVVVPAGIEKLNKKSALIGTWVDAGSWGNSYYEISKTGFKNYGDYGTPETAYNSYEGNNLYIGKIDETSGYIYMQYTKAMCYEHSDFTNYVYAYDEDALDVGNWYALSYTDLSADSVKISGAYGVKSSTETLEEAVEEFTVENGYFSFYSTCAKQ